MSTVEETLGGRNEVVSSGPAIEERKDNGGSNLESINYYVYLAVQSSLHFINAFHLFNIQFPIDSGGYHQSSGQVNTKSIPFITLPPGPRSTRINNIIN